MKKYSSILFDVDGTLLDTSEGIISSVEYTIKKLGLRELNEGEKKTFIGPPIFNSFRNHYPDLTESQIKEAGDIFRDRYSKVDLLKAEPYDGIIDLLSKLKDNNYHIGVATYKRQDYATDIVKSFGLDKYCDCIVGADFDNKLSKQDIIQICIEKLNVHKAEILMIGDTDNDKIGAERAGVDFLAVTYGFGYRPYDELDCMKADSVYDISKIIMGTK